MNTLIVSFFFLIVLIFFRSLINLVKLFSNLAWLRKYKINSQKLKSSKDNFIICIPMLREQKIVLKTIEYFSKLNYPKDKYKIYIVTTSRELKESDKNSNHQSTYELASVCASKVNKKLKMNLVEIVNYSGVGKLMSHQINYVIKMMAKRKENLKSIFAVYNADSRPNLNTLSAVSSTLRGYEKDMGIIPNIVQQSSLFTLNFNNFSNSPKGYVLRAAAIFQTKWTLIHELSRFRKQSLKAIKKSKGILSQLFDTQLSHCVGHGLFVRLSLLSKEFLPTETLNEDLPFGYYQCCKREPILPFPMLENSEVPLSITSLINQKKVWFFPYLEYDKCQKRVVRLKRYKSLTEVYLLTLQGQLTGLIWLFQSAILFIPLMIAFYLQSILLLSIWTLGMFLYWFLPVGIIYLNLNFLESIAGTIMATYDFVTAKYFDKPVIKLKTER